MGRKAVQGRTCENIRKNSYKTKECAVLFYNEKEHYIDVNFSGYGIRLKNIFNFNGSSFVTVKYTGEIGKENFTYGMKA